jgi:hypothetical protein
LRRLHFFLLATTFDLSTVRFVGWQVTFDNRLYGLEPMQYRVDAVYAFPAGESYAVNDWQTVSRYQKTVSFTGRVGNSGGARVLHALARGDGWQHCTSR